MTVMLGRRAPSGVELLIAWLKPLSADVGPQRPSGGALPYRMVTAVAGSNDKITEKGVYSVHDFAATYEAAETQAMETEDRILALGPPLAPQQRVTISGGRIVFADSVTTALKPIWQDFGDNTVFRFVARYAIDLRII